ncbi:MAG: TldD/PmbA family protein [Deltaproteobacteria bacterium]|nr:MAG: TldD/PmbA family protein [Deltaproteobacteria bacterium]
MTIRHLLGRHLPLTLALLLGTACQAHAGTPAKPTKGAPKVTFQLPAAFAGDSVMTAMLAELERSHRDLRLPDYDTPYYVAYTVKETDHRSIAGKQGAVFVDEDERTRTAFVDVRVGGYAFDNSEDVELDWVEEGVYEPSSVMPIDDSVPAIRHALWLITDLRYRQALSSYLKVKGQRVYKVDDAQKRPSFSPAPPAVRVDAPIALGRDDARWQRLVAELGAILASDPEIFDSEVNVVAEVETRWLANTEGVRLRTVQPMYAIHASAYTRAADGMLLDTSFDFYGPTEADLPDDATLVARTRQIVSDLAALRAAPVLDPYTGPAILESAATGVFFHEVLGHRLEGHRQQSDTDGQTFAKHLGHPVLPDFLSLVDDPTRTTAGPVRLNGHYAYDDEGVAAQQVVLVDHGVLKAFLSGRRPPEGFDRSNGHGRAQGNRRPVSRMGNLVVEAHTTVTDDTLRAHLLEEVRKQGKPFGLVIRDISGGSTNTSSYGYQAFKGEARMVYKVDAATGAETLVRGVEIVGTPLVTISKIIAAGTHTGVFNGYCGAESGMVPVSTVAPATLFSEIELQRSAKPRTQGPALPPPPATTGPGAP